MSDYFLIHNFGTPCRWHCSISSLQLENCSVIVIGLIRVALDLT